MGFLRASKLALQLIDQIAEENYDPTQYEDEEKKRVLSAIDEKIAGKQIVTPEQLEVPATGEVIDLMDALRASLAKGAKARPPATRAKASAGDVAALATKERKGVKRVEKIEEPPDRVHQPGRSLV
jgi:DNA end-binding protein Ku